MTILTWWGIFLVLCLLVELSSPGYFFFLSFSVGALAAAGAAWYDASLLVQGGIFVGISALTFFFLRRYVVGMEQQGAPKTNVYAMQGKRGIVTEEITSIKRGWVKVDGELWAAAPCDDTAIEKGALVKIVGNAGSHLTVKKLDYTL